MVAAEKPSKALQEDMYEAARILASGWNVERMRLEGYGSEANQFNLLLETLVENELIDQTYALRDEIVEYLNSPPGQKKQPTRPVRTSSTTHDIQENFFFLDDQANPAEPSPAWLQQSVQDPEADINRMHNVFQRRSRQSEHARHKLLAAEAAREWRHFLKAIGAPTPAEKREQLSEKADRHIALLKALGFWEEIRTQGISHDLLIRLKQALQKPPRFIVDPTSSDEVTIFDSSEAMALKAALDSFE